MVLQNQHYTIMVSTETSPPLSQFDIVYDFSSKNEDNFFIARIFKIKSTTGISRSIALTQMTCAGYEHCAVLEDHFLTTVLFDVIVRIDLTTGLITQQVECDNMSGLFEIHPIDTGYIIWGEGDIFRYDAGLNRVWRFMGRDILVSLKMDEHFWIEDGLIHCRDFLGWHYIIDFDGKLVNDFREFHAAETL